MINLPIHGYRAARSLLINGEQPFVDSADFSSAIDEVNSQNPRTRLSIGSEVTHAAGIFRMDVKSNLIARNSLVRELLPPAALRSDRRIPSHVSPPSPAHAGRARRR
jgi:hypothetical protein